MKRSSREDCCCVSLSKHGFLCKAKDLRLHRLRGSFSMLPTLENPVILRWTGSANRLTVNTGASQKSPHNTEMVIPSSKQRVLEMDSVITAGSAILSDPGQ